jgi:hypothetical protein
MTATRPAIVSPALLLRFVSIVACSVSFYLPLAVIPVFAAAGGSTGAAGLANGGLLLATVAGELVTPRIVARLGYRSALAGGLLLLGAPALLLRCRGRRCSSASCSRRRFRWRRPRRRPSPDSRPGPPDLGGGAGTTPGPARAHRAVGRSGSG